MRVVFLSALLLFGSCSKKQQPPPGSIVVELGEHRVFAEVAATEITREQGLMFRKTMPDEHGMLFVFPYPQQLSFWMKNTYIPLSIAFLDDDGVILNIEDMSPLDEHSRARSYGPAKYALEVNKGWFDQRGVKAGDQCEFELPTDLDVK